MILPQWQRLAARPSVIVRVGPCPSVSCSPPARAATFAGFFCAFRLSRDRFRPHPAENKKDPIEGTGKIRENMERALDNTSLRHYGKHRHENKPGRCLSSRTTDFTLSAADSFPPLHRKTCNFSRERRQRKGVLPQSIWARILFSVSFRVCKYLRWA